MKAKYESGGMAYPGLGVTRRLAREASGSVPSGKIHLGIPRPDAPHWPEGFATVDLQMRVGTGDAAFSALAQGIMCWEIQRRAGLRVSAPPRAEVGARVVSGFGVGALRLPVPCEVVWAQEPAAVTMADGSTVQMAGFGYGTLPGHPAVGEEAFLATLDHHGAVRFRLLAFSRPAGLVFKLGTPVTKLTQRSVTKSYLRAARSLSGCTEEP